MALVPVADDIWLAEGPIVDFYSFPYPTRSVLIRLGQRRLWVWSPVALTAELRTEVDALGQVDHLVSPNRIHHLFLDQWKAAYPDARLWGPAQTVRKRPDLPFEAPLDDSPPAAWAGVIDQVLFTGSLFMDEMVFFHRTSRTAILADLSENFTDAFLKTHWQGWRRILARHWGIVEGKGYAPLEWRLSWLRRATARRALGRLLGWRPERVIMAHGKWQSSGGTEYLKRAFAWLGPPERPE